MDRLFNISEKLINKAPKVFERYINPLINWDTQLIGLSGARGSGKTVILLQHAKKLPKDYKTLYVSLDDVYFSEHKLIYFAEEFINMGGKYLLLDEVHKYPNWSQELKNIYDYYPELRVVFTSSSALEIHKGKYDLSRRAEMYYLAGMSFREFIEIKYKKKFSVYSLLDIVDNHRDIANDINKEITPLPLFKEYLEWGYYPFFINTGSNYLRQLNNTVNLAVEVDLPAIHKIDYNSVLKIKKLIAIMSNIVPFTPNIKELAAKISCTRDTLLKYLSYLDKAGVVKWLSSKSDSINYLNKPDKLYLNNTNLCYALSSTTHNIENIRETFFLNQLSVNHNVSYPKTGDFLIDNKILFEVGGKGKSYKQIAGVPNSYIAADNIVMGFKNKIPLWLFGFMY